MSTLIDFTRINNDTNGKPITIEIGEIKHKEYKGASYKEDGNYYFFLRQAQGYFYYTT